MKKPPIKVRVKAASSKSRAHRDRVLTPAEISASKTIVGQALAGDWAIHEERAHHAENALTLRRKDIAVQRAFLEFGLDPANPYNWRKLLDSLCDVVFPAETRGRPSLWDTKRRSQLLDDFRVVKDKHPRWSEERACEALCAMERYVGLAAGTLRRQLSAGRRDRMTVVGEK